VHQDSASVRAAGAGGLPAAALPPGTPISMRRSLVQQCDRCGRRFEHGYTPRCATCTGPVEILYDLDTVKLRDSIRTSERFADLLPLQDPRSLLFLGEGNTPCVRAGNLGESLGLERLYVKQEAKNPTGTTKDRMAAIVLSMFKELGITEFYTSSTGNSSTALARGIALYPYFKMHLFIGGAFHDRVRFADNNPGVVMHVMEGLSFSDSFTHARDEAKRVGLPFEGGFFNPARREGLKLAYFEAVEQVPTPIRWYFQAASSAMGVYGTWKGARELRALHLTDTLPRLVCVQQETCCPMVKAFEEGSPEIKEHHVFHNPTGIAKAILRGDPRGCYPYVYSAVRDSEGTFVSVSESEILEAQVRLREMENLECGPCGGTTIAAVTKLSRKGLIPQGDTVLLNLTD
jgi:threonine synthase